MKTLKDTSLCAIVRDEKMNPAGGVERFLRSHLPYVEEAVVVDTGSRDGTREVLDALEKEFAHLKVYDSLFGGYAMARNVSLGKLKTTWALVLDADELIEPVSFENLIEQMSFFPSILGINFAIKNVWDNSIDSPSYSFLHNPRLFDTRQGFEYSTQGRFAEWLRTSSGKLDVKHLREVYSVSASLPILHFRSSEEGLRLKHANWYGLIGTHGISGNVDPTVVAPSAIEGFSEWKEINPQRNNYPG